MSREGVWTKAVVDAFVDEACLSDEEGLRHSLYLYLMELSLQ
jgi:hypothetical protein